MRTAAPTKRSRVNAFQRAAATGLELDELVRDERTASLLERRGIGGDGDRSSDSRPAQGMARSTRAPGGRRQWPRLRVPARVRDLAGRRGHRRSCAVRRPAVDDSALGRRRQALRTLRARRGERRPFDDRRARGRLPPGHARRVVLLRHDLARGSRKRARSPPRDVLVPRDDPRRGVSRRRACGRPAEHAVPAEHLDHRRGGDRPARRAQAPPAPGVRHQPRRLHRRAPASAGGSSSTISRYSGLPTASRISSACSTSSA